MREPTRLYLITPPQIADLDRFAADLEAALDAGDVACLQIRLKPASDAEIMAAAERLTPLAQARGVAVLINDRPDIAKACGADGVHLGQSDMTVKAARAILGADAIIGVTCHDSRHLALEAGEAGADYVAFGAFFPTTTKDVSHHADPDILTWWQAMIELPCVAIGGIGIETAATLADAGADFIAVSSAVWTHPEGAAAAVAAFNRALQTDTA
jgi:thiamine-phosphate pyrophosphorylase